MLARLIDTSNWGSQEWLAAVLLAFIIVTMGVVLRRLVGIWQLTETRRKAPNLRPLRRRSSGNSVAPSDRNKQGRLLLLMSVTLLVSGQSQGIIIRHDMAPNLYEARASDHPAVFFLEQQGRRKICVATLIHSRWAITAAHCLEETALGKTLDRGESFEVRVANESRRIDAAKIHPLYNQQLATDVDIALLHFEESLSFPRPISLPDKAVQVGQLVQLLGWGFTGQGVTGRDYDDGRFRQAHNRLTAVDTRLRFAFDDPRIIGNTPEALEGMPSLGDSGGPALISTEFGESLVGIVVGELKGAEFSEETQGQYGAVAVYEHVLLHTTWIASVIGSLEE